MRRRAVREEAAMATLQIELEDLAGTSWWAGALATLASQSGGVYLRFVGRVDSHRRYTGARPRATRSRSRAVHPAPSSLVTRSTPSTSRWPSALTPVAITTYTLTMRWLSRQRTASASSHIGVGASVQRPGAEGSHRRVQTGGQLRHLRLRQRGDPKRLDQPLDPAGRHPAR